MRRGTAFGGGFVENIRLAGAVLALAVLLGAGTAAAQELCGPAWAPCAVLQDDVVPVPASAFLTGHLGLAVDASSRDHLTIAAGPTAYAARPLGAAAWTVEPLPQTAYRAAITLGVDGIPRAVAEDNVTFGSYHDTGSAWWSDGPFPTSQLYTPDFFTAPDGTEHLLAATQEGFYKPLYLEHTGAGWSTLQLGTPDAEYRLLALGMSPGGAAQAAYTSYRTADGARLLWSELHGTASAGSEQVTTFPLTRDEFFAQTGLSLAVSRPLWGGLPATPHLFYGLTSVGGKPSAVYYATRRWDGTWDVDRVEQGRLLQTCPPAPTAVGDTCTDDREDVGVLGIVARCPWEVRMLYARTHSTASFTARAGPGGTVEWGPPTSSAFSSRIRVAWPHFWEGFARRDVVGGAKTVGDATVRLAPDGHIHLAVTEAGGVHRLVIGAP